jgi:lysozyme
MSMSTRTPRSILNRVGIALAALLALALLIWVGLRSWHPSSSTFPDQGIEVSAAQGEVDWRKVRADGVSFAYLSGTSGDAERDPRFAENWQASAAAGIKRGALHHFHLCRLARDQATNFIATVPREANELPAAVDLDLEASCATRPARSVLIGELATFIRMVEAHTEKPMVIRLSRAFENEYQVSRAIDRPLWLISAILSPSYGERPWIMWQANSNRSVDGVSGAIAWSVVRP